MGTKPLHNKTVGDIISLLLSAQLFLLGLRAEGVGR